MSEELAAEMATWNPHWNYHLGGEPRSICACPDGVYEGARPATWPRYCERCGGLYEPSSPPGQPAPTTAEPPTDPQPGPTTATTAEE